jgi:hypothetical protein
MTYLPTLIFKGVLSIKEGHGAFLVRMPDGKAQRFSVRAGAGAVEITRNGKTARYNELKVSDSIQVKYLERRDLDSGLGGHFNGLDFFPIF